MLIEQAARRLAVDEDLSGIRLPVLTDDPHELPTVADSAILYEVDRSNLWTCLGELFMALYRFEHPAKVPV